MTWLSKRSFTVISIFVVGVLLAAANQTGVRGQVSAGVLSGIVTDEMSAVIPGARLSLRQEGKLLRETRSDDDGNFAFDELPFGKYELTVQKEGFADKVSSVTLDAASERSDLSLTAGGMAETVTIVLDTAEAAVESTLKLPVSIHETPRSLTVVGSERIREQNLRQVPDVLNFVPGTTLNSYRNGSYHFYSRGYRMGPEDTRVDGFSGINVGSGGFGASTFGVEEVVVLKGPAGLIYGQSANPGGLVNLISKRPQERRFTRLDVRTAGYSGNGVSILERPSFGIDLDTTGSFTRSERVLYRAMFTLENMNYFTRDTLDRNRYANGSVLIKLDEAGQYVLNTSVQYTRYNRPYGGGVVVSPSSSLSANDGSNFLNVDNLSSLDVNLYGGRRVEETGWAGVDLRGVVSDKIRVNAAYRFISFDTDIDSLTPQVTTASQIAQLRDDHVVSRVRAKSLTERDYHNFSADASYEWYDSPLFRNTTQAGFYSRSLISRTTSPLGPLPGPQSPIHVYTGQLLGAAESIYPGIGFGQWGRDLVWNGFLQNRTSLDNGRWNITIGLNYGGHSPATGRSRRSGIIPNASVVFNATPELALYGSYSTSFSPNDPNLMNAQGIRGTFGATTGSNYEAGAKYDLLSRRVSLAFALFQNQMDNALAASDTFLNGERYYIPAGTRRARGAEASGHIQIRQDLYVSGGVAYTQATYRGLPVGTIVSSSPIPNSWAEKTPRWTYNVYARYDRREGYLKGFGAGFGMSWQGKRIGGNGARTYTSPDPLVLPSFTRLDAAFFYRLNKHVNFALNADNMLDEVIFVNASVGSNIEVAAPRALTFRTSFNF